MKQYSIITWTIALYLAYILCSLCPYILPAQVVRILPILVLLICCSVRLKACIFNPAFVCACLYALGIIVASQNHVLTGLGYGRGGWDTVLIDLGFTLPPLAMGAVFINRPNDVKSIRIWDIVICLSIIISACWMIPTILKNRSISRYIAVMEVNPNNADLVSLKFGYWNYTMCHVIALFFAPFVGLFYNSTQKNRKILYGIMAGATAAFVVYLAITTTFIYLILAIIILLFHRNKHYGIIGTVILLVGLILLAVNIDYVLDYLLVSFKDTDMYPKLVDFKDILNGGMSHRHGSIDGRAEYQLGAINGFIRNPIFGSTYAGTGGHSILLNRLGTTGLIGFIPYVLMLIFTYRQWYKLIPTQTKFYYNLAWLGAIILLYNKNCFGAEGFTFICVILPCLCQTFSYPNSLFPRLLTKKKTNKPIEHYVDF